MFGGAAGEQVAALGEDGVGVVGGSGAVANGEAHLEAEGVDGETEAEDLVEGIAEAAGDDDTVRAVAEELAAAAAGGDVAATEGEVGAEEVGLLFQDEIVIDDGFVDGADFRAQANSAFDDLLSVELGFGGGRGDGLGEVDGHQLEAGVEVGAHLAAESVFGLLEAVAGLEDLDFGRGVVGFGLVDIEGADGAEFEFAAGAFEGFA